MAQCSKLHVPPPAAGWSEPRKEVESTNSNGVSAHRERGVTAASAGAASAPPAGAASAGASSCISLNLLVGTQRRMRAGWLASRHTCLEGLEVQQGRRAAVASARNRSQCQRTEHSHTKSARDTQPALRPLVAWFHHCLEARVLPDVSSRHAGISKLLPLSTRICGK